MEYAAIAAAVLAALAVAGLLLWRVGRRYAVSVPEARAAFEQQRAELERIFLEAAGSSGKPRGLIWKSSELGPDLALARDKQTGELVALVSVTIAFEAVPGSDMEGLPAVGNLRSGSAVFAWRGRRWTTSGRAVFNLSPPEAIRHFRNQYEALDSNWDS